MAFSYAHNYTHQKKFVWIVWKDQTYLFKTGCFIIGLYSNTCTKDCDHSPALVCPKQVFGHRVMFGGGHVYPRGLHVIGWNDPAATNAPVEDEAVEAILGMNQKPHPPCPNIYIFFPASTLPQNISLLPPTYLPPPTSHLPPPSYLPPTSPFLLLITIAKAGAGAPKPEQERERQSPTFDFQTSR